MISNEEYVDGLGRVREIQSISCCEDLIEHFSYIVTRKVIDDI